MSEEVYRRLARRLDTIPHGFPATESGVEFDVLERLFAPEEAALACDMSLVPETAADIASRAGMDLAVARQRLDGMVDKGLVGAQPGEGERSYRLSPRVTGLPGFRLPLRDVELARLAEQYYQETRGIGLVERAPASVRVIPVQKAIPTDLQIHPYEQASTLLENAKSWGVRDCICRAWQRSIDKGCDHALEVCLGFSPVEGTFDNSEVDRALTKEEALRILQEAEEEGLVHTTINFRDQPHNICNCCTCCCGPLRVVAEFGIPTAVARSDFQMAVQAELCDGCSACVGRCQFKALSLLDGIASIDLERCVGCGVCAQACATGALHLERLAGDRGPCTPSSFDDWVAQWEESHSTSLGHSS
jgi:Fe-S-cluster-containing hydrogenase component 2